ncbi:MAG: DNA translocase FtsK [Kiritimatiellae bacterium]|nr:DNA translocase FtsK [Kiritimatiellia bacterium]
MSANKADERSGWGEAGGLVLLVLCILMVLSVFSYDAGDIPLIQSPPNDPTANFIGPLGAWFAFLVFMLFGVVGYLVPLAVGVQGLTALLRRHGRTWPKAIWMALMLVALVSLAELQFDLWAPVAQRLNLASTGGVLGNVVAHRWLVRLMGEVGTVIVSVGVLLVSLILLFEVAPIAVLRQVGGWGLGLYRRLDAVIEARRERRAEVDQRERELTKRRQRIEEAMRGREETVERRRAPAAQTAPAVPMPETPMAERAAEARTAPAAEPRKRTPRPAPAEPAAPMAALPASSFNLPAMGLLDELPPAADREIKGDFQTSARILKETMLEFGVDVEVTNIERGPVVTRYELLPAPGVRVERIVSLSNNIALAMKAESVRVQAPIPGKGVVGIEVPNPKTTLVYLREILESGRWQSSSAALPLALGKDVSGRELVSDLAEMPHLLIAGATGSGKTVCVNSLLAGLLMSRTPDQLRLMLVDPKIVEFAVYKDLPHLVVPVITDAKKVNLGLRWAINEMEKRYKLFAKVGVRNIQSYNARPIVKQEELFAEEGSPEDQSGEPPTRLPYLVIVIDELADLMLVAQAEIEMSIARLAQLSRAVGIHMVIATQRPSVNVITGTIKANLPARLAFQVASKVDSRTILDANGADKLLGKGDMLFLPPGSSKLTRAQGTMTTDQEIRRIVDFYRGQGGPQYEGAIKEKIESTAVDLPDLEEDDDLIEKATEVIRQTQRASTSSLQRRLRIGYTRAARLMDLLEERGVVGPPRGSEPREILFDLDGEIPQNEPGLDEEPGYNAGEDEEGEEDRGDEEKT